MFKKSFLSVLLFSVCLSAGVAKASTDPYESAGLRHLFFPFGGVFLLDFDPSKKLINETSDGDQLVVDHYASGFRYQQNLNAGLGWSVPLHYSIPTGISVGLDLMASSNSSFDRYVGSAREAQSLPAPVIPNSAHALAQWKTGDNVLYRAKGGIGFSAGLGFTPVAGVAAYYFAEGDWVVYIEKTNTNRVYLKVTSTQCRSLGALAASVIAGVNVALFAEVDKMFSFSYDTTDREAMQAYEDAIHGSLVPSERLAERRGAVQRVTSSDAAAMGIMRSWYFGIPLFAVTGERVGNVQAMESLTDHTDGSHSVTQSGIYVDHRYTAGFLSLHKRHLNDFFGSTTTTKAANGQITKTYSGYYFWAFESSQVGPATAYRELADLTAKTGIRTISAMRIPTDQNLGYVGIKFGASMPQNTVDVLMNWAKSSPNQFVDALSSVGDASVSSYFNDLAVNTPGVDATQLCFQDSNLVNCRQNMLLETRAATTAMVAELRAMARAKDTDPKAFALHFGNFGKQMATNPFTFREVLEATRAAPMTMTLSLEGERLSRFRKTITQ